jgi:hypothetical protein
MFHLLTRAICSSLALFALAGCALPGPQVPDKLKAPSAQDVNVVAYAQGVQIYECQAGKVNPARFEWVFKAPQATLADRSGKTIGKHYGGPTWESDDGSKVVGQVVANDPGPDANAIPWLLLSAKSVSGNGVFGRTQTIQRVQTVAGKAPGATCEATQAGTEARVPYQAVYYFYNARS